VWLQEIYGDATLTEIMIISACHEFRQSLGDVMSIAGSSFFLEDYVAFMKPERRYVERGGAYDPEPLNIYIIGAGRSIPIKVSFEMPPDCFFIFGKAYEFPPQNIGKIE